MTALLSAFAALLAGGAVVEPGEPGAGHPAHSPDTVLIAAGTLVPTHDRKVTAPSKSETAVFLDTVEP
jgi:hypothetical protein